MLHYLRVKVAPVNPFYTTGAPYTFYVYWVDDVLRLASPIALRSLKLGFRRFAQEGQHSGLKMLDYENPRKQDSTWELKAGILKDLASRIALGSQKHKRGNHIETNTNM